MGYKLYLMREDLFKLNNLQIALTMMCFIFGYALQLFWYYKITRGAIKLLMQKPSSSSSSNGTDKSNIALTKEQEFEALTAAAKTPQQLKRRRVLRSASKKRSE